MPAARWCRISSINSIIDSPSYGPLQNKTSTCNTVEVPKFHPRNFCAPETPGLFNTGDAKLGFSMGVICRRSSGQKERKTHFGRKTHGDLVIISYSKRECGTLMSGILFFPSYLNKWDHLKKYYIYNYITWYTLAMQMRWVAAMLDQG